ncbi:MAG: hypothetical protein ACKOZV_14835, partial [Bacteroidota bacterium]
FQLRSTGYAPSKTQKLTKNQPVLPTAENPEQALMGLSGHKSTHFSNLKTNSFIFLLTNNFIFHCSAM